MPIVFKNDFEDPPEVEGTPPDDWPSYGGYTFDNREIDDLHPHSGSQSLRLKARSGGNSFCGANTGAYTNEKVRHWVYLKNTTSDWRIITCKNAPGYIPANYMAYLFFSTDGRIYHYDTGANDVGPYAIGLHYVDIIHDWDNDTFDAWYDGEQIVFGGSFFSNQVGSGGAGSNMFMAAGADNEVWVDDVQIGENGGFPLGPAQSGPIAGGIPT